MTNPWTSRQLSVNLFDAEENYQIVNNTVFFGGLTFEVKLWGQLQKSEAEDVGKLDKLASLQ